MQKISNIPQDHLFPKPCRNESIGISQQKWYNYKLSVGKNTIDCLMRNLSNWLKLLKIYTNRSIRVTHITVLIENGFSNSEIASSTGYKNPESTKRYARKRRHSDVARMSLALLKEVHRNHVGVKNICRGADWKTVERTKELRSFKFHRQCSKWLFSFSKVTFICSLYTSRYLLCVVISV